MPTYDTRNDAILAAFRGMRPGESPIHPVFEWDDSIAAEEYRLSQARSLVKSVVVVTPERAEQIPAFVHVRLAATEDRPKESYYQSTEVAIQNVDEWASAIQQATSKADSAVKAVEMLRSLSTGKPAKTLKAIKSAGAALEKAKAAIAQVSA